MRGHTQTHYCQDAACPGFTGFSVRWAPDTGPSYASGGEPGYPLTDTCPHCGAEMADAPVKYEDAIAGLLDELYSGNAIGHYEKVNERAMLAAIQAELKRQRREAFNKKYEQHKRIQAKTEAYRLADERAFEMELPF